MGDTIQELQKWSELRDRFPASAWVALWYAKLLRRSEPQEYEQRKSRLLLSFFNRKKFHEFNIDEFQVEPVSEVKIETVVIENEKYQEPEVSEIVEETEVKSEVAVSVVPEHETESEEIIDNLIEKFSNDPPKIQFNPEIHDENYNYGKSSCIENPEIISETLALIFAEQGYVGKAIKIYKKLSLHNPEKSCYFADQIKKLKTEKK